MLQASSIIVCVRVLALPVIVSELLSLWDCSNVLSITLFFYHVSAIRFAVSLQVLRMRIRIR